MREWDLLLVFISKEFTGFSVGGGRVDTVVVRRIDI